MTPLGMTPRAHLVSIQIFSHNGTSSLSALLSAISYLVLSITSRNASSYSIINLSLGMPLTAVLNSAVTSAVTHGITVVVAAGNNNGDATLLSPASASGAITVGAIGADDTRSGCSNWREER